MVDLHAYILRYRLKRYFNHISMHNRSMSENHATRWYDHDHKNISMTFIIFKAYKETTAYRTHSIVNAVRNSATKL